MAPRAFAHRRGRPAPAPLWSAPGSVWRGRAAPCSAGPPPGRSSICSSAITWRFASARFWLIITTVEGRSPRRQALARRTRRGRGVPGGRDAAHRGSRQRRRRCRSRWSRAGGDARQVDDPRRAASRSRALPAAARWWPPRCRSPPASASSFHRRLERAASVRPPTGAVLINPRVRVSDAVAPIRSRSARRAMGERTINRTGATAATKIPEDLSQLEDRAAQVLEPEPLAYILAGAGNRETMRANATAFRQWRIKRRRTAQPPGPRSVHDRSRDPHARPGSLRTGRRADAGTPGRRSGQRPRRRGPEAHVHPLHSGRLLHGRGGCGQRRGIALVPALLADATTS